MSDTFQSVTRGNPLALGTATLGPRTALADRPGLPAEAPPPQTAATPPPRVNPLLGAMRGAGQAPVPGLADRISTRTPDFAGMDYDPHTMNSLGIDLAATKQGDAYTKNVAHLRAMPEIDTSRIKTDAGVYNKVINHFMDNLRFLYDNYDKYRDRASLWYDGANKIAHDWAGQYGLSARQVAGMMARLSPKTDWFKNVENTRRILDIHQNDQNTSMATMDPALRAQMQANLDTTLAGMAPREIAEEELTPGKKAAVVRRAATYEAYRRAIHGHQDDDNPEANLPSMADTAYGQMRDPVQRAIWMKAYDEARMALDPTRANHPVVMPEGDFGGTRLNLDKKTPTRFSWQTIDNIARAISIMDNDSLPHISRQLGGVHKIRSFYNNIISPLAPHGDVTIDTHAIAAAHLMPLAQTDRTVELGLGGIGAANNSTGSNGLYSVYAEAYRRLAKELGIQPRQLQSITWEAGRGLFQDRWKTDDNKAKVAAVWKDFRRGKISGTEARTQIKSLAGGIDAPDWA